MNPIALNPDEIYEEVNVSGVIRPITFNNSSYNPTILKYRYKNLLKIDASIEYKKYNFNINVNYNDYMKNIDKYFTTELVNEGISGFSDPIIPGINTSRELNKNGDLLVDLSIGFRINSITKLNYIINNVTNVEIYRRPTDLLSPRRHSIKLNIEL